MAREKEENLLDDTINKFRDRVTEQADKFREKTDEVRERLDEATDNVRLKSEETWKDAVKFTQKHPAQAIGLAILVGAALGILLVRGRRD